MKKNFKKFLSGLLAAVAVLCTVAAVTVCVGAAECENGKHTMRYSVVNGELHHACKKCGANDTAAEKNADGGPVIYLGLNKADGTARDGGNGFTPAGAIKLEDELANILSTYKSKNAKPVTVVVVGQFVPELNFTVDAGAPVTFTSVWNGVDYREAVAGSDCGNARLLYMTNMHCYNDIVFDKVVFEHPKGARCIGMNGHNLTVTDVRYVSGGKTITNIKSTAMYAILSGDFLDDSYVGKDLANLDQTISVDSGMWLCIDVGCYRSVASAAFPDMSGNVTVNISGDAQIVNRAKGAPWKYRGLSAAAQILSAKGLHVVYNISGGKFALNEGLNVIGRDSQAPKGVRNIAATYNISGGDFGGCAVYATVRDALTNSIPTVGQVAFNLGKGLNFGNIEMDEDKDILGGIGGPAATTAAVVVTEPPAATTASTAKSEKTTAPAVTETAPTEASEASETQEPVATADAPATDVPTEASSAADATITDASTEKTGMVSAVTSATAPASQTETGGSKVVLILCIAVAAAAVASAVLVVVAKKKKAN